MKKLLLIFFSALSLACHADLDEEKCSYLVDKDKLSMPSGSDVLAVNWIESEYKDSLRAHVQFKDGDIAIINISYCEIYSYQATLYTSEMYEYKKPSDIIDKLNFLASHTPIKDKSVVEMFGVVARSFRSEAFSAKKRHYITESYVSEDQRDITYEIEYEPLSGYHNFKSVIGYRFVIGFHD